MAAIAGSIATRRSTVDWMSRFHVADFGGGRLLHVMGFLANEHVISGGLLVGAFVLQSASAAVLLCAGLFAFLVWHHRDFIYRSYLTLDRDVGGIKLLVSVKLDLNRRLRDNRGVHEIFMDNVRKHPDRLAIQEVNTLRKVTFAELNAYSNRFASYFKKNGYKQGDVVALFMENSIEFVACWVGLAKLGVITAWVNSSLKMEQLAHCIQTSGTDAVISSRTLASVLKTAKDEGCLLKEDLKFFVCDLGDTRPAPAECSVAPFVDLSAALAEESTEEPPKCKEADFKSVMCFIYTSGTTGMPKAAVMKHFRYYNMAVGSAMSFDIRENDRIYISMPLYHTSAGIIGIGQTVLRGSTAIIRQKFSASNFWKDCVKFECTASQYIGEICRYLLAQPPVAEEKQHQMRLMYGNGLRAEIWQEFVDRFGVKIGELYGSTEGTSNLVNIDGKVGSCGFLPISPITSLVHPVRLVKVDVTTGDVIRAKNGLCIPCRPGETGAMVSTIRRSNPLLHFEGYLNSKETDKKVLHDVFRKGDSVFLSGDILHWDRLGYLYFRDRTGDTFRWKGENISTTEVEKAFYSEPCIRRWIDDVTVYGVKVPHTEGRCGMAAVVKSSLAETEIGDEEFVEKLGVHLRRQLIAPAVPVFIRLCSDVQRTGTFKLIKTHLQRLELEANNDDRLYVLHPKELRFVPLNASMRSGLDDGSLGL